MSRALKYLGLESTSELEVFSHSPGLAGELVGEVDKGDPFWDFLAKEKSQQAAFRRIISEHERANSKDQPVQNGDDTGDEEEILGGQADPNDTTLNEDHLWHELEKETSSHKGSIMDIANYVAANARRENRAEWEYLRYRTTKALTSLEEVTMLCRELRERWNDKQQEVDRLEVELMDFKSQLAQAKEDLVALHKAKLGEVDRIMRRHQNDDTAAEEAQRRLAKQQKLSSALKAIRWRRRQIGPIGEVVVVVSVLDASAPRTGAVIDLFRKAAKMHYDILRDLIHQFHGFEAKYEDNMLTAAFKSFAKALQYTAAVQMALLRADWPSELLEEEGFGCEYGQYGSLVFRGLRVGMAMQWGSPKITMTSGRTEYFGPVVETAIELAQHAKGGEILCAPEAFVYGRDILQIDFNEFIVSKRTWRPGDEVLDMYSLLPSALKERTFNDGGGAAFRTLEDKMRLNWWLTSLKVTQGVKDTARYIERVKNAAVAEMQAQLALRDERLERQARVIQKLYRRLQILEAKEKIRTSVAERLLAATQQPSPGTILHTQPKKWMDREEMARSLATLHVQKVDFGSKEASSHTVLLLECHRLVRKFFYVVSLCLDADHEHHQEGLLEITSRALLSTGNAQALKATPEASTASNFPFSATFLELWLNITKPNVAETENNVTETTDLSAIQAGEVNPERVMRAVANAAAALARINGKEGTHIEIDPGATRLLAVRAFLHQLENAIVTEEQELDACRQGLFASLYRSMEATLGAVLVALRHTVLLCRSLARKHKEVKRGSVVSLNKRPNSSGASSASATSSPSQSRANSSEKLRSKDRRSPHSSSTRGRRRRATPTQINGTSTPSKTFSESLMNQSRELSQVSNAHPKMLENVPKREIPLALPPDPKTIEAEAVRELTEAFSPTKKNGAGGFEDPRPFALGDPRGQKKPPRQALQSPLMKPGPLLQEPQFSGDSIVSFFQASTTTEWQPSPNGGSARPLSALDPEIVSQLVNGNSLAQQQDEEAEMPSPSVPDVVSLVTTQALPASPSHSPATATTINPPRPESSNPLLSDWLSSTSSLHPADINTDSTASLERKQSNTERKKTPERPRNASATSQSLLMDLLHGPPPGATRVRSPSVGLQQPLRRRVTRPSPQRNATASNVTVPNRPTILGINQARVLPKAN
eukprot:TRINITY_DN54239_c0_g1_i1.p1 TRINITY_DN54239_c0_g1~~TRINITY_DN54239_c0_g1_i1.p1  ORF type:complete len:1168 (+),score=174.46 TRINITY_DN54239_c0_g1_i1:34-3537(+)